MKQYQGAVLFVDILGIGAITRSQVELTDVDYDAHGIKGDSNHNSHYLGARLLIKFRKVLNDLKKHRGLNVAQLSDCAFIWSKNPITVLDAATECMWALIKSGVLCRGGIAYGNIVEPDRVNTSLGRFVLGEAATKAVDMEKSGKGCRIFSDVDLPSEISGKKLFRHEPFHGNKNPNDCSITDEFRWYLFPNGISNHEYHDRNNKASVLAIMKAVSMLKYSPMFGWNVSNRAGEIQVASSIDTLTSGVSILAPELNYNMPSEYLIGHLKSQRSNALKNKLLKTWTTEINGLFKQRKPIK